MIKLLSSRLTVVIAASLFAAATWMTSSIETRPGSTSLVLAQPEDEIQIATLEHAARF